MARGNQNKGADLRIRPEPLWYKDAIVYQLHVKSFFDANDDGVGDFDGLTQKLDYIESLGVNTIWLLPFYPSPRRDDGYDIASYRGIHGDYGRPADFRRFIDAAHARGLRVITELVINHTSDQHPWFQRARKAPAGSAWRDFYVWSDNSSRYAGTPIIFCDVEPSNWSWDPVAGAYYWHRFYSHQPDLNFDNPRVLEEVLAVLRHWLDLGVDGLRLDAVPYLIEREGTACENLPETHEILRRIRAEVDRYPDRMLLAEANMWPEDTRPYFGEGDECHMAFHFPLMPRMYMAVAQEDRFPITDILRQTPELPPSCQWAIFLRNHDELTLAMVTDRERDYLWQTYASDQRARLNLGIRRRLAPLLERDRRRIELLHSLLLSMPGTPVLYYGDELGMGDNIHLGDRDGVRTPMQWSPDRNGGFSRADPARLVLPAIMDPLYGYAAVNVEAQARDPHSLLNWTRRMLAIRRQHPAFGRGPLKLLYPSNRRVLAYLRQSEGEGGDTLLCIANLSRSAQAVELNLASFAGHVPVEMIGGSSFPPLGKQPWPVTLPPYGFFWFLLAPAARLPTWHVPPPEPLPDYATFVLRSDIGEIFTPPWRALLEQEVLPPYLARRRWFEAGEPGTARLRSATPLARSTRPVMLAEIEAGEPARRYLLPLAFLPEEEMITALPQQLALARVRRVARVGHLTDAVAVDAFALSLVSQLRDPPASGEGPGLRLLPAAALATLELPEPVEVRRTAPEEVRTRLVLGNAASLTLLRRLQPGTAAEVETGRLLEAAGYPWVPPLLGEVAWIDASGQAHTLAFLQRFLHDQGNAWDWLLANLRRAIGDSRAASATAPSDALQEIAGFSGLLGRRLGELHRALSGAAVPEAPGPALPGQLDSALESLAALPAPDPATAGLIHDLHEARPRLLREYRGLAAVAAGTARSRIHGDLQLEQVLTASAQVYFINFAEAGQTGGSPWKDVASMLRSFEYALAGAEESLGGASASTNRLLREALPEAFLGGYREATVGSPWRGSDAEEASLLRLFTLERAASELRHEALHRPEWLLLPLRGLLDLAGTEPAP